MHRLIAAAIVLLGLAAPAFANPDFELGPAIGTTAPSIGALQDIAARPALWNR